MYKLDYIQELPISLEEARDFFSAPVNLEKIKPLTLAFKIKHRQGREKMYVGEWITYKVKPYRALWQYK